MKSKKELGLPVLLVVGLISVLIINAYLLSKVETPELAKAVFHVA
jgi:hypothetical protein